MLRKYGIGLAAVIIAAAMAAFTTSKNTHLAATHVFEFDGTTGYTEAHVTNPSNTYWKYVGETSQESLCSGSHKACRVAVTSAFVDDPSTPTELSGVSISASTSGTGDAIVTGITDPADNMYSNQQ